MKKKNRDVESDTEEDIGNEEGSEQKNRTLKTKKSTTIKGSKLNK